MQKLIMAPAPGEGVLRFVGDRLRFTLSGAGGEPLPRGWRAMLRTTLGGAEVIRPEIIYAHTGRFALTDASWRDIPMNSSGGEWSRELACCTPGYFRAKAYAIDARGQQHWPGQLPLREHNLLRVPTHVR